jgi:hypothetical protein
VRHRAHDSSIDRARGPGSTSTHTSVSGQSGPAMSH